MSQIIKKAIVKNADLPSILVEKGGYFLRYRVVSEDKNRISHWSNALLVDPGYTFVSGDISINKQTSTVSLVWDPVEIKKDTFLISKPSEYDLWIKWGKSGNGDWLYSGRIAGTTTTLNIPTTYFINGIDQTEVPNQITVEVYLKGIPVSRDYSFLQVYSSGPHTV